MRTKELKKIAEENGYVLTKSFDNYKLKRKNRGNCIDISGDCENKIWISNSRCCDDKDFKMIKAAVKFAETPIEDREGEKYYLVKFSEKEIEEIKKKFDTDLKDFELVEVGE